MTASIAQFNGKSADADVLAPLAFSGYAHFTAMQVRGSEVRGLDLHLARLREASDIMFRQHLPDDLVRSYLQNAIKHAPSDSSVTCFVSSRPGEFTSAAENSTLDMLIKVTAPAEPPIGPLSLDIVEHERHLPRIKHVGEVSKTVLLRSANLRGFDDAAFTDSSGRLTEATIWNLAFWDGESVIWPRGEILTGVTMQILRRRLESSGVQQQTRDVRLSDLKEHHSAVVMNSWSPGIEISQLGGQPLKQDVEFTELLHSAYQDEPQERI